MPETNLKPHFNNYNRQEPFPRFQKPELVDGFSLEQDRSFSGSPRKYLKFLFLRPPSRGFDFDLNVGYEEYVPGPKEVHITSLLKFIQRKKGLVDSSGRLPADFVCYRGLFTQILITPYFPRDTWSILAIRFRGSIYLCNYVSPEKQRAFEERDTDYSKKCSYYGKNFERFIFTDDPTKQAPPVPTEPLQDVEEFNVVLTTKLEGYRLLYAAEMDGVDASRSEFSQLGAENTPLGSLEFVEVKTRMREANEQQFQNYLKWKLPKWWCQSFLVGIDTIYSGFRSRDGHVKEIETVPVRSIPKMCAHLWSPAVMMRFGADFLSTVQSIMEDTDCPDTVYKFNYNSNVSWNVTYEVYPGRSEFSFLPQSYIDFLSTKPS